MNIDELRSAFTEASEEFDDALAEHIEAEEREQKAYMRLEGARAARAHAESELEAAIVAQEKEEANP